MTTLLIDNYDSFTWNVYQYLSKLGAQVIVYRNDEITLEECISLNPRNLVISPGPGHPSSAGISNPLIHHFAGKIPILGICLGEQAIYEAFGGIVSYAGELIHGKTSSLLHDGKGVDEGLPQGFQVTRYHSLVGDLKTCPKDLEISSKTESGLIMGVRHKIWRIEGVQFHPESIVSEYGLQLFSNFLSWNGPFRSDSVLSNGLQESLQVLQVQSTNENQKESLKSQNQDKSILEIIKESRLQDIQHLKSIPGQSRKDLERAIASGLAPPLIDFEKRLKSKNSVALLAEIKRASPSKGNIHLTVDILQQAREYTKGGAAAISVLTEPKWFKGSCLDLNRVRLVLDSFSSSHLLNENVSVSNENRPAVLRKDFILDEYQILESRLFGADSILLIVAILSDSELFNLLSFSRMLGMEPLVEVSNEIEMKRAIQANARIIGVNNRDLHTFTVNMERTVSLSSQIQDDSILLLALSGITCRQDVEKYVNCGAKGVLVGEALMKSKDTLHFMHELQLHSSLPFTNSINSKENSKVKIKMCGMTRLQDIYTAVKQGVDYIGFIFVASSKRQVTPQKVKEILTEFKKSQCNSKKVQFVGIFSNSSYLEINSIVKETGLDLVQLHGSESVKLIPLVCVPVIKVIHVLPSDTLSTLSKRVELYANSCKYILLDTGVEGGSGKTFDWNLAQELILNFSTVDFFIAGGLNPNNIQNAITLVHPMGVDVSSGIESEIPGEKDSLLIEKFVENLN